MSESIKSLKGHNGVRIGGVVVNGVVTEVRIYAGESLVPLKDKTGGHSVDGLAYATIDADGHVDVFTSRTDLAGNRTIFNQLSTAIASGDVKSYWQAEAVGGKRKNVYVVNGVMTDSMTLKSTAAEERNVIKVTGKAGSWLAEHGHPVTGDDKAQILAPMFTAAAADPKLAKVYFAATTEDASDPTVSVYNSLLGKLPTDIWSVAAETD